MEECNMVWPFCGTKGDEYQILGRKKNDVVRCDRKQQHWLSSVMRKR